MKNDARLVSLGIITTAHGVRGQVKLRSFTADPRDVTAYGPLSDKSGRSYEISITGETKDALIATVRGVTSREAAEALRNTELFVAREALPATAENEYYHEDLVGLALKTAGGGLYGTIAGVHNFGAGDLIAVRRADGLEEFLPFTRTIFPTFDFDARTATINPPEMLTDE